MAEFEVEFSPCGSDFFRLACFERFRKDSIAVIVVQDENVLVASGQLRREPAGLIRVGFVEIGCGEEERKDRVGGKVLRLLRGVDIKGGRKRKRERQFCRVEVLLLHAQMTFACGERFGKMFRD